MFIIILTKIFCKIFSLLYDVLVNKNGKYNKYCYPTESYSKLVRVVCLTNIFFYFTADADQKSSIRQAIKNWEKLSCLKFQEVDNRVDVTDNHIKFMSSGG